MKKTIIYIPHIYLLLFTVIFYFLIPTISAQICSDSCTPNCVYFTVSQISSSNPSLVNYSCPNVQVIIGGISIKNASNFLSFNFPNLVQVNGSLTFQDNPMLNNIYLPKLVTITGQLNIQSIKCNLSLPSLVSIGDDFRVDEPNFPVNIYVPNLQYVGGDLNLGIENALIVNFPRLISIGRLFLFTDIDNATAIYFDRLATIGTGFTLLGDTTALKKISFASLATVSGPFSIDFPYNGPLEGFRFCSLKRANVGNITTFIVNTANICCSQLTLAPTNPCVPTCATLNATLNSTYSINGTTPTTINVTASVINQTLVKVLYDSTVLQFNQSSIILTPNNTFAQFIFTPLKNVTSTTIILDSDTSCTIYFSNVNVFGIVTAHSSVHSVSKHSKVASSHFTFEITSIPVVTAALVFTGVLLLACGGFGCVYYAKSKKSSGGVGLRFNTINMSRAGKLKLSWPVKKSADTNAGKFQEMRDEMS